MGSKDFTRAALVATMMVTAASATMPASAEMAAFEGNLSFDNVGGCGFVPDGDVSISVDDQGAMPIFAGAAPSDPGGCFGIGFPFDLQPGMHIRVTDGVITKDVLLVDLRIEGIDHGANMIFGVAPPGSMVHVDADTIGDGTGWQGVMVQADPEGFWAADFNSIGVDIFPCMQVGADTADGDGDRTATDAQECDPGPPPNQPPFTDPGAFRDATAALGTPRVIDFDDIDAMPGNGLEGRPPFDGSEYAGQGIAFEQPNGVAMYIAPGGLRDCDAGDVPDEPCNVWNESNSLSIGEFPFPETVVDDNDDDLVVRLDPPLPAVAFTLVDTGGGPPDEFIQYLDADGALIAAFGLPGQFRPFRAFAGFISPGRPIAAINIVEGANDGDDVDYDDFILVPPPTPDFAPTVSVSNQPLRTDQGDTPLFAGWARTVHVDVANLGGARGDAAVDVWVTTPTDGTRTFIGSRSLQLGAGRTLLLDFAWNGAGALGDVIVEAITCSEADPNDANNLDEVAHHVLVGGTGFGATGPVTFAGSGTPACA